VAIEIPITGFAEPRAGMIVSSIDEAPIRPRTGSQQLIWLAARPDSTKRWL
jgi:hypothetical protein